MRPPSCCCTAFRPRATWFRNLIPALAHEHHVIAPDLPGFGFTELPDRTKFGYSFDNLAKVILTNITCRVHLK